MVEEIDPIGRIHTYIAKNFPKVIREIVGIDSDLDVFFKGLNVEEFTGSGPMSLLYKCDCKYTAEKKGYPSYSETKEISFFAKYFKRRPPNLPEGFFDSEEDYWKVEYDAHSLFKGLKYVPNIYPEINGRILVVEYIPGKSLEKVLEEKNEQEKESTVKMLLEKTVSKFHEDARERMSGLIRGRNNHKTLMSHFRGKENSIEKALGYIRAIKGLKEIAQIPELVRERFSESYWPIARAYDQTSSLDQISHGDLTATNIIMNNKGDFFIIDPKVKFRQQILDVSTLLTSPGMKFTPETWLSLAEAYWTASPQKKSAESLLFGCIHESLKKLGKGRDTQKYFPSTWLNWFLERESFRSLYGESMKNSEQAINYCIDNHLKLRIDDDKIQALVKLRNILFDEKWISPEDISHIKEARRDTPESNSAEIRHRERSGAA